MWLLPTTYEHYTFNLPWSSQCPITVLLLFSDYFEKLFSKMNDDLVFAVFPTLLSISKISNYIYALY